MNICVIGGAGYVGTQLVPELLHHGHVVTVMDSYYYGNYLAPHQNLKQIKGDIRDHVDIGWAMADNDVVIHLACISNDPSFELSPKIARGINLDCFPHFVNAVKRLKPKRVIFASSSSVYGLSDEPQVTEDTPCRPLTDYSRYKLRCEKMLLDEELKDSTVTILRPATVCGYSPRLRLDVIVNALTINALAKGEIVVHGGTQVRPNVDIHDMVRAYVHVLKMPPGKVDKKIYNVGGENHTVNELAFMVQNLTGAKIKKENVSDNRSYRINSSKILRELDFKPVYALSHAVETIKKAYEAGLIPDYQNPKYYNLRVIKELLREGAI